jgi:GNAT superfamily N-acetyltransferase
MKCPTRHEPVEDKHTQYEHTVTFCRPMHNGRNEAVPIHFRLINIEDEQRLLDFFHSHTEATIHSRYGMVVREMSSQRALELVCLDCHDELAIVGLDGPPEAEFLVAIGRYALEPTTNLAEVAFVVHEHYRGMGIATHLLQRLVEVIRQKGFSGITVQVLAGNTPMLNVLSAVLGRADQTTSGCGEMTLIYRFKESNNTAG